MRLPLALSLAALLVVAGCSKDKDVEPPAKLVDFPATLAVKKIWSTGVGGGKKQMVLRLGVGPAIDAGNVFAASHKGEVVAIALDSGRQLWRIWRECWTVAASTTSCARVGWRSVRRW